MTTIEKVFEVFGEEVPSRSSYSATVAKPFPALTIMKEFKTWAKFEKAYLEYVIQTRNKKAKEKVVTKPGVKNVKK